MIMTIENKRRELFEQRMAQVAEDYKYTANHGLFKRAASGEYLITWVDCAWIGFNAALDAVVITLPKEGVEWDEVGIVRNVTLDKCRAAIEQTGLGLKVLP